MGEYQPGTDVGIEADFTVGADVPTDPTTVTFNIRQPDDTLVTYVYGDDANVIRTSAGVYNCVVSPPMSGLYRYNAVGTGAVPVTLVGTFLVEESIVDPPAPPPPGPTLGPCQMWIAGEDVRAACPGAIDLDQALLDTAAFEASMALYEISGRRFSGLCERTVRPTADPCNCWPASLGWGPLTWMSQPWGSGTWGWWDDCGGGQQGCWPVSSIKLSGYPVREIVEVKIGGEVLPELDGDGNPNYRLDGYRSLTRMNSPDESVAPRRWPGCQQLALDDTEPGTFAITYRCGQDPPQLGRDAAAEIACQLVTAFNQQACQLPAGTTKVTRVGVTVERGLLANWFDPKKPTGLVHLDLFLRAYYAVNAGRRPAVWSPDRRGYAPKLG